MAGGDRFDTLVAQLAVQVRLEHQREVDELKAEIAKLSAKFDLYEKVPPPDAGPGALAADSSPDTEDAAEAGRAGDDTECNGQEAEEAPRRGRSSSLDTMSNALSFEKLKRQVSGQHGPKRLPFMARGAYDSFTRSSNPAIAFIENLVHRNSFDIFFSVLIAMNAVTMAIEAQYYSSVVAVDLGYSAGPTSNAASTWSNADLVFGIIGFLFGVLFTVEIVLRIIGFRIKFVFDAWNWIDLTLVSLWIFSNWESLLPVNPVLPRLARFAKLFRLLRLVRKIQGFDPLFLMATAIKSSMSILGWTCCLLFVLLLLMALLLHALLMEFYLKDTSVPFAERQEIFQYFGSFTTSLFSMFELTLANWPPISRALYQNVNEWFIFITIFHKLTIGFAFIGIINGVFIQETFNVAQQDDEVMLRRARLAGRIHQEKMKELMFIADGSGDGMLDIEEFRKIFENPGLKTWLASMELTTSDADALFHIMGDEGGLLSVEKLTTGVERFKGGARTIDLHMLWKEQKQLLREHRQLQATVDKHLISPCASQHSQPI